MKNLIISFMILLYIKIYVCVELTLSLSFDVSVCLSERGGVVCLSFQFGVPFTGLKSCTEQVKRGCLLLVTNQKDCLSLITVVCLSSSGKVTRTLQETNEGRAVGLTSSYCPTQNSRSARITNHTKDQFSSYFRCTILKPVQFSHF